MTSAISATEQAVYDALDAGVTLASVYQHVPEDTAPPVVVIGDIEAEPLETKGDTDRSLSVTITCVAQGEERKPVLDIMEEVSAALDGGRFTALGWSITLSLETEGAILLPDSISYVGTQTFTGFALA